MTILDIIAKKRDAHPLTDQEIRFCINEYTQHRVPDYQMAALLMAIYLRGMTIAETAELLQAMLQSGDVIDLSDIHGPKIDKHSTGGVGDKVSLILAPLLAAAGVTVPMISGRGLAHTGGTLDKLESIPGFRCDLSVPEFKMQLRQLGVAMIGQTERIAPADKKIYALRDATGTIASLPLIIASILSKKLAEGITGLVLDVKTGAGAFMKNLQQAEALATGLVNTAGQSKLPATALITRMDEPLGHTVGNWLEVQESLQVLQGEGPKDLVQVTLALAEEMLQLAGSIKTRIDLEQLLRNGQALRKFLDMAAAQGGDISVLLDQGRYPQAQYQHMIKSRQKGYLHAINSLNIGHAAMQLGAGRNRMEDKVDPKAGIRVLKKCGDHVDRGETLVILYTDNAAALTSAAEQVLHAFSVKDHHPVLPPLVIKKIIPSDFFQ